MKPVLLVTGSMAFDRIAVFKDRFANHILKGHVHNLNVSFVVEDMKVNHGGTGGNIAYNLSLLGAVPILLAAVGQDAEDYLNRLKKKVNLTYLKKYPELTASATIMTDLEDNQIASFYPGAMKRTKELKISTVKEKISMAIIAPNDPRAMLEYADACRKKVIPFIVDPGQTIPAFSKNELRKLIRGAYILVVSDYEAEMLKQKTGWNHQKILGEVKFFIVTEGRNGSRIWRGAGATVIQVPAYKTRRLMDPTGCGDAYRAGLMYGYQQNLDIEKSAHVGAWLAARCAEERGTQNHTLTPAEFTKFLKTL